MRMTVVLLALLVGLGVTPARAAEYRLQVANLHEQSLRHFVNGGVGTGSGELTLDRLEQALDAGSIGAGAFLPDRALQVSSAGVAQAFGAVAARGAVKPGEGKQLWDEVVWEGKPGERSVWLIAGSTPHVQEVREVALKGSNGLRYYLPYHVTGRPAPQAAVAYPLMFLRFYEDRGGLWERYLSKSVGLGEGIAAVVGINQSPGFPDWVYIVVQHPAEPATFKVVVAWDRRENADRSSKEGRSP